MLQFAVSPSLLAVTLPFDYLASSSQSLPRVCHKGRRYALGRSLSLRTETRPLPVVSLPVVLLASAAGMVAVATPSVVLFLSLLCLKGVGCVTGLLRGWSRGDEAHAGFGRYGSRCTGWHYFSLFPPPLWSPPVLRPHGRCLIGRWTFTALSLVGPFQMPVRSSRALANTAIVALHLCNLGLWGLWVSV